MRLRVTNLGPVDEAELDLSKRLVILSGPNNSGKTYLSWLVYSLARLDARLVVPPPSASRLAKEMVEGGNPVAWDAFWSIRDDVFRSVADCLRAQLATDFAAPKDRFEKTRIEIVVAEGDARHRNVEVFYGRQVGEYGFFLMGGRSKTGESPADVRVVVRSVAKADAGAAVNDLVSAKGVDESTQEEMNHEVARLAVVYFMAKCVERGTRAFPVERLAINLFARELAANRTGLVDDLLSETSESIEAPNLRDHLRGRASRYPLVIRDALQHAIRLSRNSERGPFAAIADELERSVLGGQVKVNTHDELEFAPRESSDVSLGLHESASVVKSLASLVLFLRYEARPGQRLLIDEPELNLHPDNQRRVARILAKAVNQGLKILMSTHSDSMIREFNNLIMLGQDTDEARALIEELGYDPETTLKSDLLGVYLVDRGKCIDLPVSETGFEISTIDQAIHDLNRDAQTIYLRLFGE